MVQQHPQFYNMEFSQKTLLFRKTIETIYYENEHVELNYQQLQELNKTTIRTLLERFNQPAVVVESSEDKSVREFREREEEYEKMNKKPTLPDAKKMFEEPVVDDVITNMEERLQQYQSQRNDPMEELATKIKDLEQRVALLESKQI